MFQPTTMFTSKLLIRFLNLHRHGKHIIAGTAVGADAPTIEFSNANFKEVGVIGAEALRTETETIGDYKLGINTVARAPHDAYANAWVENLTTDPRANLDVVGNAYH